MKQLSLFEDIPKLDKIVIFQCIHCIYESIISQGYVYAKTKYNELNKSDQNKLIIIGKLEKYLENVYNEKSDIHKKWLEK